MRTRHTHLPLLITCLAIGGTTALIGQNPSDRYQWELGTRILATGTNRASNPAGYKMYTSFPLEVALRRSLGARFRLELAARNDSREIDREGSPTAVRLGSIEFVPMSILLQYRLRTTHNASPYLGLGANATLAWEKSGVLDSMNVSPSLGLAVDAGVDLKLTDYLAGNLDLRWNTWATNIDAHDGSRLARLMVDAASLGFGLAVRF
jgi:outer membrane protein W